MAMKNSVRFRSVGFSHRHETTSAWPRALASPICSSEAAIDAYLMFALAEAKALIIQHRDAVLAIANALMVHRTLDAVMIHKIIASAPERARRADWARVQQSAADFAAREMEGAQRASPVRAVPRAPMAPPTPSECATRAALMISSGSNTYPWLSTGRRRSSNIMHLRSLRSAPTWRHKNQAPELLPRPDSAAAQAACRHPTARIFARSNLSDRATPENR
jgi:hypothetical protein